MPTIFLDFSRSRPLELRQVLPSKMQCADLANRTKSRVRIPAITDLSAFSGESVLCIVDSDNLDISLKPHGLEVQYDRLLTRLRDQARQLGAVAVITSNPGDCRREYALDRCGWQVVSIQREIVIDQGGMRKVANADADLCYELGARASVTDYSAVCLGTGDGDLAVSCSRGLKRTSGNYPTVHTLSVAGATSTRLGNRRDLFASSILVGMDLLERMPADRSKVSFLLGGFRNALIHA